MFNYKITQFAFGLAICLTRVSFGLAETKPLNVLFLFADDQRADTISAYGNPDIRTPNLDKLIADGSSFRCNYVFGSNNGAVCVPSRAMLMTGKAWTRFDAPTIAGQTLLPELLQKKGYVTFATGKWHNGQASWLRGFQQGKSIMFGGMSDHTKVPLRDLQDNGKLSDQYTPEGYSTEMFANRAIEFLESPDADKPFFAYVAFTSPHDPRQPPDRFRDIYTQKKPPLPANFLPQHPFDNGMMNGGRDENLAAWPRTESVIRDQLGEYYGMVSHLDEQIGRILETVDKQGLADRTLVIYAADNGLALGSHGLVGKQSLYEHSARVPLVFKGPGIRKSYETEAFTYLFDVFPTVCDLLGVEKPTDLDGKSLVSVLKDPSAKVRESVFLPFTKIQRSIRDEDWKLICYPQISHKQLFHLKTDPDETRDVATLPENRPVIERLEAAMAQSQKLYGDTLTIPTENEAYVPIDLSNKPRKPDQWQPEWIVKKYFSDLD